MNKLFWSLLVSLFMNVGANEGKINADHMRIIGAYTQGGVSIPLQFTKITDLQETKKKTPKPGDIDGAWIGGPSRLRFVLHIITDDDGMTAKLDSPDQNSFGIPVTTITRDGAELRFETKPIRGVFEGKINPELTTISGTWKQGGASILLTLRRTNAVPQPGNAVTEHKEVFVAMRDGARLATDLYFPSGPSNGLPVVLERTPYNKEHLGPEAKFWTSRGYVYAVQDVRGRFRSEGRFEGWLREGPDGFDTIEWLAGIGGNTVIFIATDYVVLRPFNIPEPDRLVWLGTFSAPNFEDCKKQSRLFESLAASVYRSANLTGSGDTERVSLAAVSADFFNALKMKPALGRGFLPEEDKPDGPRVAVLSEGFWRQRFGADPQIVGKTLTLDDYGFTIIGVMSREEQWPDDRQFWLPLGMDYASMGRGDVFLKVIGRLKPGVSWQQAQAEMDSLAGGLAKQYPETNTGMSIPVVPLIEETFGLVRPVLLLLQSTVGFILLIACANVAGLLLTRGASREKEVAIRTTVGASRWRLVRQLGAESMILSILGGALALLVIIGVYKALDMDNEIPTWELVSYLLGVTFTISLLTGLIFGLLPALQISSPNLNESLKEGGRGGLGFSPARLRSLLVISELALTVILLAGAMLMLKRFVLLMIEDPGFKEDGVLSLPILLNSPRYSQAAERAAFSARLISELRALPEVESVGITANRPFCDSWMLSNRPFDGIPTNSFVIEGRPPLPAGQYLVAENNSATTDYFRAMHIPALKGRVFTGLDTSESPAVAVISETMARRFWPGEDPLGQRITINDGGPNPCQIVGVVGDVKPGGLGAAVIEPMMYRSFMQYPTSDIDLMVRSSGDVANLTAAVLNRIRELDRDLAVDNFITMSELGSSSSMLTFWSTFLLMMFAGLAIGLAMVGVYGVMSYVVHHRTREIGIRIALGAESSDVLRMVLGQGMRLAAAGVALGTLSALAMAKLIASFSDMPFNVSFIDLPIFVSIALLLLAVALMPCFHMAWRATKIVPLVALRRE